MAISAYTKTAWANSPATTSAVGAANLQHIEDQVKDITDAAVSGGASPTKIWTSTNDGNGGQPPAPKPQIASGITVPGFYLENDMLSGGSDGRPGSGTWTYEVLTYGVTVTDPVTGAGKTGGTIAGGSSITSATGNCRVRWTRLTA